ncbi:DNA helicase [Lachnospiraceae bacterium]|uniref:UvrD-helicase domain-containing protein n=1 Tax=Extibacter sp. GGCC_0201 TaxID=2731209 RepID=UPI001AA12270|nr:UvrD-helicase domain-containing protein [Extibacter sp. GGCC_0201]MBO1722262.1 UvrD-helicase domain-containing protein [Extibacter sp. GGCC_0201]BDF32304.1 DNA helicase [Lachnospiraceae bacterium]BDF36314.1 DNA helicase [Lachnospiraceae bacterium]
MYIADLHIHSRYSRATSKDCTPEYLDLWARRKGIHIVGSGDFTHPAWREELAEKLMPAEEGLYVLKKGYRIEDGPDTGGRTPRFVITGEISSIYKRGGRVRKVHSLILLPGLEAAEVIARKLEAIGNIHSDGRPILGLDCHDLLEIVLELCPDAIFVPAHIWTPHFSLFGAFSGFDTVEECFGDLSPYIHAMETGLSSDPPMNWRVSMLDSYQLISNSDAHSPAKLGREANMLDIALSYPGLRDAVQYGKGLYGTIEFFPEEGKYHFDGHRKCSLCLSPADTDKYHGICPVCGKKITIGVSHRVDQLSDRGEGYVKADAARFESLVPLPEVIGASVGHAPTSAGVQKEYLSMLKRLGPEFDILREVPVEEIRSTSGVLIAEGIRRLREGKVIRVPGFDGEYGTIRLFEPHEIEDTSGQMDFFDLLGMSRDRADAAGKAATEKEAVLHEMESEEKGDKEPAGVEGKALNKEQEYAVTCPARTIAVVAGPGTGKTRTLVSRILYLLEHRNVKPYEITAVTFTNEAARELKERIQKGIGSRGRIGSLKAGTFHAICLEYLKEQGLEFSVADETEAREIADEAAKETGIRITGKRLAEQASMEKSKGLAGEEMSPEVQVYNRRLKERGLLDFDDLLLETLQLLEGGAAPDGWQKSYTYLFVDEFQDINPLQYRLVKAWNEKGRELFVIGDPDQSIYGFRGADAKCFARLQEDFPGLKTIRLTENYRSTPEIVSSALHIISGNPGDARTLHANRVGGAKVRLARAMSPMGEAIFVAKEINRLAGGIGMLEAHEAAHDQGERKIRAFDDIAVLYRTHQDAELLETCLKREGIPYVVAGRESFLQEDIVRGSLFFFRYLADELDRHAKEQSLKILWNLDRNPVSEEVFGRMAEKYRPLYAKEKPQKFLKLWMQEIQALDNPAMKKLSQMAVFYKDMGELSDALSLGVESDLKRCGDRQYGSGAVTLMTLHGSKGLEYPVTFIFGVRKGKMPLENERYAADMEEERRLFYVGMTRAEEELILTSSGEDSVFVEGMPDPIFAREQVQKKKKEVTGHQMSLFDIIMENISGGGQRTDDV